MAGSFLVLLLGVLAVLQLHWLREVAAADRQRREAALDLALADFAADLDREVSRAWLAFRRPSPLASWSEEGLAASGARWLETAPIPELVGAVLLVDGSGQAKALDLEAGRWERWTGEVPATSRRPGEPEGFAPRLRRRPPPRDPEGWLFSRLRPDLPGLELRLGPPGRRRQEADEAALFVLFDRAFLRDDFLPALVERHFVPILGREAEVRITARESGELLYAAPEAFAGHFAWQVPLFDLLPPDELHRLAFATGLTAEDMRAAGGADGPPSATRSRRPLRDAIHGRHRLEALSALVDRPPGWQLEVGSPEGSLDPALARAHHGNAAVALGILGLLTLAAGALLLSARRARETARRQLEFTAAVSHELRTPLAAIRSLADNLADGLVREPAQARLYGEQISRQGRRLTEMVEQVLAVSAVEAGGRGSAGDRTTIDPVALVREVVAEIPEAGKAPAVELDLPAAAPGVAGDRTALRGAVQNLVVNALRHGEPPVVVRVTAAADGTSVAIAVSDHGAGIPDAERERLFEPFFRGARAQAGQLPGAGLGLHLVRRTAEAHGGRVEVSSGEGAGTTFTLILPATAAEAGR